MSLGIQASLNKFASLHIQDSSEDEERNDSFKHHQIPNAQNNNNMKKKTRRRKKKQQANAVSCEPDVNEGNVDHMKDWIKHDKSLVEDLYDDDLKQALEQSRIEFERFQSHDMENSHEVKVHPHEVVTTKLTEKSEKKKGKKSKTISLEKFHQHIEKTLPLHHDHENVLDETTDKKDITKPASNFFNEVEKEVKYIKRNESTMNRFSNMRELNKSDANKEMKNKRDRMEILKVSQEKEEIISQLQSEVKDWKTHFKHVKKRNQQLLLMLQQGEMKGKCELLLEIERLGVLRDELTEEVGNLNESLEQERSRSRKLKDELLKYQGRKQNDEQNSSSKS